MPLSVPSSSANIKTATRSTGVGFTCVKMRGGPEVKKLHSNAHWKYWGIEMYRNNGDQKVQTPASL